MIKKYDFSQFIAALEEGRGTVTRIHLLRGFEKFMTENIGYSALK
jgi:hypothetical protein